MIKTQENMLIIVYLAHNYYFYKKWKKGDLMAIIYPSLLAAPEKDLMNLIRELEPYCKGFHIDIMDNKFVPNTGISIEKTNEISEKTIKKIWVHLMVENPKEYLNKLQLRPGSIVTFHIESHKKTFELIKQITEKKLLPGIAINPKTGLGEVFPFLGSVYQLLIMSVEPGFAGQLFNDSVVSKIDPAIGYRSTFAKFNPNVNLFKLAMDGGINVENIAMLAQKGVEEFAVGSEIFKSKRKPLEALQLFQKLAGEIS
jgi:ribulose-phosphate 3-epimerase